MHTLVWYGLFDSVASTIRRAKAFKEWKRQWKIELIERPNLLWRELYEDLL